MSFIVTDVLKSSSEFDDLFQLTDKSRKIEGSYTPYVWKAKKSHFFRGCDYTQVFPLSINLYLKICTEEELTDILNKKNFLRVRMYYDNEECSVSCIAIRNLTIDGLDDPKYKEFILSCPNDMIPCEINMGPIWHYTGINRVMFKHRQIELAFEVINLNSFPSIELVMGITLLGRDAYPDETTEEIIKQTEDIEDIFIIRK